MEFGVHICQVKFNGAVRNTEPQGNLLIAFALQEKFNHLFSRSL